jgi:hypothetical protein
LNVINLDEDEHILEQVIAEKIGKIQMFIAEAITIPLGSYAK